MKVLLVFVTFLFCQLLHAHSIKMSTINIEYSKKKHFVSLEVKMFSDDFKNVLESLTSKLVDFSKINLSLIDAIDTYIQSNLQIKLNDEKLRIYNPKMIYSEENNTIELSYRFDLEKFKKVSFEIRNSLMISTFYNQINYCKIKNLDSNKEYLTQFNNKVRTYNLKE
jgi:hypothetical protein